MDCPEFTYQNLPGQSTCFDCPGLTAGATGASACSGYCNPGTKKSGTEEQNGATVSTCVNCESGKYSDKPEQPTCKTCPAGYHARSGVTAGAHVNCQACAKGRHGNDESGGTESTVCVDCVAGKYNIKEGLNKGPCSPCNTGTYSIELGQTERAGCRACEIGKYSATEGASTAESCSDCNAGRYSAITGADSFSACKKCPAGFQSSTGAQPACLPCQAGRFQQHTGQSECAECNPGKYRGGDDTAIQCLNCPKGYKTTVVAQPACTVCQAGRYQQHLGKSECDDCETGKYRGGDDVNSTSCIDCLPGTQQPNTGQASCLPCLAGQRSSDYGSTECISCSAGMYLESKDSNATSCLQCPSGFSQKIEGSSLCIACIPGQHRQNMAAGALNHLFSACEDCLQNQYAPLPKSAECLSCPLGYVTVGTGSSFCRICSAGKYTDGTSCVGCPSGYKRNNEDSLDSCLACDAGKYQVQPEQVLCLECIPGKYSNSIAQLSCKNCAVNHYQAQTAQTSCIKCPSLSFTDKAKGKTTCQKCQAGESGELCTKCEAGLYRGNDDDECMKCTAGYFAADPGAPFCLACAAGTYAEKIAATKCLACSNNTFVDEPRATTCRECVPGLIPNNKSTACEKPAWPTVADCKDYFSGTPEYLNDTSTNKLEHECILCPEGADCRTKQTLSTLTPVPEEWWQVHWMPKGEPTFVKCPYRGRCFKDGCTNFTGGPLCAVCADTHYRDTTGLCLECTESTVPIKIGVLGGVVIVLFLLIYSQRHRIQRLRAKYADAWRDIVRIFTINLSYAQVSSSLPSLIQVPWPPQYLALLDHLSWVNVDVVSLFGFKCVGGDIWDFRGRLLMAILVPVVVLIVCFLVYVYRSHHVKQRAKPGTKSLEHMAAHSVEYIWDMFDLDGSGEMDEEEFHNLLRHLKASKEHTDPDNHAMRKSLMRDMKASHHHHEVTGKPKRTLVLARPDFVEALASNTLGSILRKDWVLWAESQRVHEHFLSDTLLILFLLHAPLSQRGFYFFACQQVGDRSFLLADFTIQCYASKHAQFVPIAIGFLVAFSFLLPTVVLMLLCCNHKKLHTPEVRHKFGFLYAPFNRGGEYWEIHEVFRKLILTGLLVFIPESSRPPVAIVVSVMSVASLNYVKPHKK